LPKQVSDELELARESAQGARAGEREALIARCTAAEAEFQAGRIGAGYLELGRMYLESGMKFAAMDLFKSALEVEPDSAAAHRAMAETYRAMGKQKQAREHEALAGGR
jgi:Tfp pilus assembly protein PilF